MQSIYPFREADVKPLTLSANFRAQGQRVAWINETFPSVFPDTHDLGQDIRATDGYIERDRDGEKVVFCTSWVLCIRYAKG